MKRRLAAVYISGAKNGFCVGFGEFRHGNSGLLDFYFAALINWVETKLLSTNAIVVFAGCTNQLPVVVKPDDTQRYVNQNVIYESSAQRFMDGKEYAHRTLHGLLRSA